MIDLTKSQIETLAIYLLQLQGFQHLYGADTAPDRKNPSAPILKKILSNQSMVHTFAKFRDTQLPKFMNSEVRAVI